MRVDALQGSYLDGPEIWLDCVFLVITLFNICTKSSNSSRLYFVLDLPVNDSYTLPVWFSLPSPHPSFPLQCSETDIFTHFILFPIFWALALLICYQA